MALEKKSEWASFGGTQTVYTHDSAETGTAMDFSIYTPPQAADGPVPVLTYLSGLTCNWENVTTKGGFQGWAAERGLMIVCPDTSPRGESVPNDDAYDFGQGAGFYVNATQQPWSKNYRMYAYITEELPAVIGQSIPAADMSRQGIFGHSMGGHGALTIALRNPDTYRSVSAFAPIVSPMNCPWGEKALGRYIGDDHGAWTDYDACAQVQAEGWHGDILIDQGTADTFLEEQLKPQLFIDACGIANVPLTLRMQEGYDHSYYFMASFMKDHIDWHADRLGR